MTEPTNKELDAVITHYRTRIYPQDMQPHFERAIMRAVLARWGQPATGGAPVAWLSPWRADQVTTDYDAYGEHGIPLYTTPQPTHAQAVNQADRPFIVRLAEDFAEECVTAGYVTTKAASYGRLMDEALSTQAQAGAVPLTDDQIAEGFAERHHGIKGGQHG